MGRTPKLSYILIGSGLHLVSYWLERRPNTKPKVHQEIRFKGSRALQYLNNVWNR